MRALQNVLVTMLLGVMPFAATTQSIANTQGPGRPDCTVSVIVTVGQPNSPKIISCTPQSPEITAMIARLEARLAQNEQQLRDFQRALIEINSTARQLPKRYADQFAKSLLESLVKMATESDERILRQIERQSLDLADLRDNMMTLSRDLEGKRRLEQALDGDLGSEIAKFNIQSASEILYKLAGIDKKLDAIVRPPVLDAYFVAQRKKAEAAYQKLLDVDGEHVCRSQTALIVETLRQANLPDALSKNGIRALIDSYELVYLTATAATAQLEVRLEAWKRFQAKLIQGTTLLREAGVKFRKRADDLNFGINTTERTLEMHGGVERNCPDINTPNDQVKYKGAEFGIKPEALCSTLNAFRNEQRFFRTFADAADAAIPTVEELYARNMNAEAYFLAATTLNSIQERLKKIGLLSYTDKELPTSPSKPTVVPNDWCN